MLYFTKCASSGVRYRTTAAGEEREERRRGEASKEGEKSIVRDRHTHTHTLREGGRESNVEQVVCSPASHKRKREGTGPHAL